MAGHSTPQKSGLSLYANLLDNDDSATISGAPVTYTKEGGNGVDQDDTARRQQALAASLRFQPTKRPQLAAQKAKAKAIANKLINITSSTAESQVAVDVPAQSGPKITAADFAATVSEDEDTHAYYAGTKPRGKKRKKKNKTNVEAQYDWDDIYDPSRPNNYEEYKHSEEKILEVKEWKDLLYRHRMNSRTSSSYDSDREKEPKNKMFAPPSMSFAPPPIDKGINYDEEEEDEYVPPPPPPAEIPSHASGDDAYLRRLQLSQSHAGATLPPAPPSSDPTSGQISRAPIRYNFPSAPAEGPIPDEENGSDMQVDAEPTTDEPRTSRPGQKGFAERLLTKYGWTKGSGLGAQGQGIINPLYAKADKRKKKSDAEGGGYSTPGGTGKILGGNKSKEAQKGEEGKFGAMSEVIKLEGMLDGMDIQAELRGTDEDNGGLMQEIGEECGEKYGSVERVFIHIPDDDDNMQQNAVVFVRFVSQLSALRAVNALEGRVFNGNAIKARFWDHERFEQEQYQ